MGAGEQKKEGSTAKDISDAELWKGSLRRGLKNLGRGSIGSGWQDSSETECLQPNSPLGEQTIYIHAHGSAPNVFHLQRCITGFKDELKRSTY